MTHNECCVGHACRPHADMMYHASRIAYQAWKEGVDVCVVDRDFGLFSSVNSRIIYSI